MLRDLMGDVYRIDQPLPLNLGEIPDAVWNRRIGRFELPNRFEAAPQLRLIE